MVFLVILTDKLKANGISNVVKNLFLDDAFDGDSVFIAIPKNSDDQYVTDLLNKSNVKVIKINNLRKHIFSYIKELKNIIKQTQCDALCVHGNSNTMFIELFAAKLMKIRVRCAHCHSTKCNHEFINRLIVPLFNFTCNLRIACGEDAGKWLYKNKFFTIIKNGIKTGNYVYNKQNREIIRKEYGFVENDFVIGHVGSFNHIKNQRFLIKVLLELHKQSKRFKLLFVGNGGNFEEIRKEIKYSELKDFVIFVGETNNVSLYLSAMDVIAMPSLFEGFPLTLVEEQANGLKCFVSNNITSQVNITGLVDFLPIDTTEPWVESIYKFQSLDFDREEASFFGIRKITQQGYESHNQSLHFRETLERLLANE